MDKYFLITFILLSLVLWFWTFFDILKSRFKVPFMSTVWLLIVILVPLLGSIVYLILRKKLINNKNRKFQPNFNRNNK